MSWKNTARRSATLAGVALIIACGSDKTTEPTPQATPPAALRVVFPDTVIRSQAFPLTVTALDAQGQTNAGWSGNVALSASAGAISPSTVNVVNGTVSVQATIGQHAGSVNITSAAGSVVGSRSTFVLSELPVARLEIHPQTFLLTGTGVTQALTVRGLDADGAMTGASGLTWQSSKTAVVSVSASGVATAAGSGSSTITARVGAITSGPALAYVTTPAAGVVLVTDEQVTGGITPVNSQARYGLGWQYRVRLTGTPPQVGQVLASRGEKPIAGRVIGVQSAGAAGSDVTLELVRLDQVFPNLSINESGPLRIEPAQRSYFDTRTRVPWAAIVDTTFPRGPFTCQAKLDAAENNPFALSGISNELTPTLQYDFIHTATRKRLVVQGGLTGSFKVTPTVTAALSGSLECKAKVGQPIPIPVGGALALFFGARVVVGGGFTIEGGITLATLGFDIDASAGATVSMGYDCNPGCTGVFSLTGSSSGSVKPNLPQISSDFRVTAGVSGFAWADLEVGPSDLIPGADNLRLTMVEAKAGLKQEFNLSTADVQSVDPAYASSYSLTPFFSGGIPSAVQGPLDSLLAIAMIAIPPLRYEASGAPIAESPAGSFLITPARVMAASASSPGDTATFIVNLSRTNYLSFYAVESVKLFRKPSPNGSLVPAPGSCASITPTSATQSLFTCKTDLPAAMAGDQTFYAFVKPIFLGVTLPVLLEVAADGKGTVTVDTVRVIYASDFNGVVGTEWSRQTVTQSPNGLHRFLGIFGLGEVALTVNNAPTHTTAIVEFDFHTIHDWEGSATQSIGGPDIMTFLVDGQSVLRTSFSTKPGFLQAYPGTYPNASNPPMSGAISTGALGYPNGSGHRGDATYRVTLTVPHTASSIKLTLRHDSDGESWGIDNLRVSVR